MSESDRVDRAAELLERLLADADLRARFRAQPETACREAGFPDLAAEIAQMGGSLQTLDLRESRSSLVGVLMAAAFEGMGVLELSHLAGGGLSGEAAAAAHRALTRSGMAAVRPGGAIHPPHPPHVAPPHVPHGPRVPHPAASASPPPQPAPAAADPSAAPAPADPQAATPAATGGPVADAAAAPGAPSAPAPGAAAAGPGAPPPVPADQGVPATGLPAGTPPPPAAPGAPPGQPWPDSPGAPASASPPGGGGWPQAGAVAQDHAVARAAAAPDVSMAPGAGGGGATFQQLVDDPRITFPPSARADFLSGNIDPRFVPILERLARDHPIGLSVVKTGHDQFVAGTNVVSNHFKGRALDIATVDGAPVGPGNAAAREVMTELANLDPAVRPSEVGGPWLISAPGFFSDAGHQDHIHVGFDSPAPAEAQAPAPGPPEAQSPVQPPPEAQSPVQPPPEAQSPVQPPPEAQTPAQPPPGGQATAQAADDGPAAAGRPRPRLRRPVRRPPMLTARSSSPPQARRSMDHPPLSPWRSPAAPALQGPARCMMPPPAAVARAAASTSWRPRATTPGTTRPRRPSHSGWPSGRSVPACHLSFR